VLKAIKLKTVFVQHVVDKITLVSAGDFGWKLVVEYIG